MRVTLSAVAALFAAGAGLTGCSSDEAHTLEGTAWQLVSIQSMDDAQGTTTVSDPSKFTVEFGANGEAFFQLDCNRGKGTWKSKAAAGGDSGSLTFGPIATTMMMCPQPSLDQQVSKALGNIRGYLFKDDQLHLSQLADGGILNWDPTEPQNQ
jgi:heat shock protein HslJ